MPDDITQKTPRRGAGALAAIATRDLQKRVTSGVVMVCVALALVYAGVWPFAVLILAVSLVMSWEWGHLVRGSSADIGFTVHLVAVTVAIALAVGGNSALALCALAVGCIAMLPLTWGQRSGLSALGILYVGLAAVSLVWLRLDPSYGCAAVLFLFLVVWTTDTMAFAVGRLIGGPKLWPSISPNKTWAGFLGGILSGAALAAAYAAFVPGAMSWRLGLIGLLLGVVAQAGDLGESALKRAFGVKDASALIPGHGGVMDRMDGIVTVAVAAAMLGIIWNVSAPATALLIGK